MALPLIVLILRRRAAARESVIRSVQSVVAPVDIDPSQTWADAANPLGIASTARGSPELTQTEAKPS